MLHCLQVCASRSRVDTEPRHVRFCNWRAHRAPSPDMFCDFLFPFLFIYFFIGTIQAHSKPDSCDLGLQNAGSLVRRVASTHMQESDPMHSEQDACPSCGDSSVFGSSFHPLLLGATWDFFAWVLRPAAPCNGRQRQHQHYA